MNIRQTVDSGKAAVDDLVAKLVQQQAQSNRAKRQSDGSNEEGSSPPLAPVCEQFDSASATTKTATSSTGSDTDEVLRLKEELAQTQERYGSDEPRTHSIARRSPHSRGSDRLPPFQRPQRLAFNIAAHDNNNAQLKQNAQGNRLPSFPQCAPNQSASLVPLRIDVGGSSAEQPLRNAAVSLFYHFIQAE